jgi:hypothetical protein
MLPLAQKQNERETNFGIKTQVFRPKNSEKPIIIHGSKKRNVKALYYNTNEDGGDDGGVNGVGLDDANDLINTVEQDADRDEEEDH